MTSLSQRDDVLGALDQAMRYADGHTVELHGVRQNLALTRFTRGRINQNVVDEQTRFHVRVWADGGIGWAVVNDERSLPAAIERAAAATSVTVAKTIDLPTDAPDDRGDFYFGATAETSAIERAEIAAKVNDAVGPGLAASGNLRFASQTVAVANSRGLRATYASTYAALNLVVEGGHRSKGYGGAIGRDLAQLDFESSARRAAEIASRSDRPVVLDPGEYEVVLHPPAVSMLLVSVGFVGLNAFGAGGASKGMLAKPGRRVASKWITMHDDPLDVLALPTPFDAEGTPRTRHTLIEGGVAKTPAHDLVSAAAADTTTTGHALPVGGKGPSPTNLAIEPGSATVDDLVAGIRRGLIVHRIHPFVSLRGGHDAVLSGTTRDGVFLVENGEVIAPVTNVRWTNSLVDLLSRVEGVSSERSVEFMDLPEFSPHTNHLPSLYTTGFHVHASQPRER